MADVLEWAKTQAPNTPKLGILVRLDSKLGENWKDHIGLSAEDGGEGKASEINLRSTFAAELANRKLIPAVDNQGSLVFVAPEDATTVDCDLQAVLPARDLAGLSGSRVALARAFREWLRTDWATILRRFGPVRSSWPRSKTRRGSDHIGAFRGRYRFTAGSLSAVDQGPCILWSTSWLGRDYVGNLGKWTVSY